MKKKLFLIALAIIPLTSCNIQFTNTPGGSIYSSTDSSTSSEEVSYGQSTSVPENLSSYSIVFNSNHTITQPKFQTAEEIYDAIKVKDTGNLINRVTQFEDVAYGPSCLVVKTLGIETNKTIPYSYVTINATPFYAKSYDHQNETYIFQVSEGALSLNGSSYIQLDQTHTELLMNVTQCSFQTDSQTLVITALNERIFINSITFHF